MGQEISQQKKCSIVKRHKSHQQIPQSLQPHPQREATQNLISPTNFTSCNGKYTKHSQNYTGIYAPASSISTTSSSSTDEEHYRLRRKYNLNKQTYEKSRVAKNLSFISSTTDQSTSTCNTSTSASTSTYQKSQPGDVPAKSNLERKPTQPHRRKNSSSTDSGIYYASCNCTSSSANSTSSLRSTSGCGCATSVASSSNHSRTSLDHQKNYLCRHLYIKSYLDILEEDEKARAQFKSARPGGIRNYKPKILADTTVLSTSAPHSTGCSISSSNLKLREKCKENPWI